ncbi:MAG: NAD(P)/FAD-dependent oxidoreductase [Actinomycetota bacterium]|nr:NAD(P)/FAD-dependent oxidoreductase [Actinomycetota bacterium]
MRVVIVGAGFGGIAAAIELRRHGFDQLTILERADELGGTWYHNSYPGAACDIPSHAYSFSYAQRRDWPKLCPEQPEILAYLQGVAREHGVAEHIVTGAKGWSCRWTDPGWRLDTEDGRSFTCDAVVLATGQLHQPLWPAIPGRDDFTGHSFHSAAWDHDYELAGKRVAVIGTGASAVQFVPEIASRVASLTVFQRSGNWFLPRRNRPSRSPAPGSPRPGSSSAWRGLGCDRTGVRRARAGPDPRRARRVLRRGRRGGAGGGLDRARAARPAGARPAGARPDRATTAPP